MINGVMTVITVSQLNMYVKSVIDSDINLRMVYVCGEISNFKRYYESGHLYFSLKDEESQIRAVMFKSNAARLKFFPADGMKVLVKGRMSIYEKDGQFRIYADDIQPDGLGALHLAYEQLKSKLYDKGWFAGENKKPLPKFPRRVAVITSDSGAAVRDIISVMARRCPVSDVVLCPVQVQGEGSVPQIVEAVNKVNSLSCADVIILGRGGGSIEDLWSFNDERVAEAIHNSKIPVISAVGHETDYTIADFTADCRAATPSVGAELCVPDLKSVFRGYTSFFNSYRERLLSFINSEKKSLDYYSSLSFFEGARKLIEAKQKRISEFERSMYDTTKRKINSEKSRFSSLTSGLEAMSPLKVISKGYALVTANNAVVSSVKTVEVGEKLELNMSDGILKCSVVGKYESSERQSYNDEAAEL